MDHTGFWIFFGSFAAFIAFRAYRFSKARKEVPAWIAEGAVIVDVRTPGEFESGSHPQSTNIPLDQFLSRIGELPKDKPIIVCCASGARSGAAAAMLRAQGFQRVLNAGPWTHTL
jgi:phage shock protein E